MTFKIEAASRLKVASPAWPAQASKFVGAATVTPLPFYSAADNKRATEALLERLQKDARIECKLDKLMNGKVGIAIAGRHYRRLEAFLKDVGLTQQRTGLEGLSRRHYTFAMSDGSNPVDISNKGLYLPGLYMASTWAESYFPNGLVKAEGNRTTVPDMEKLKLTLTKLGWKEVQDNWGKAWLNRKFGKIKILLFPNEKSMLITEGSI